MELTNQCPHCKSEIQKVILFTSIECRCNCQNQENDAGCEYSYYFKSSIDYTLVNLEWDNSTKQWLLKSNLEY